MFMFSILFPLVMISQIKRTKPNGDITYQKINNTGNHLEQYLDIEKKSIFLGDTIYLIREYFDENCTKIFNEEWISNVKDIGNGFSYSTYNKGKNHAEKTFFKNGNLKKISYQVYNSDDVKVRIHRNDTISIPRVFNGQGYYYSILPLGDREYSSKRPSTATVNFSIECDENNLCEKELSIGVSDNTGQFNDDVIIEQELINLNEDFSIDFNFFIGKDYRYSNFQSGYIDLAIGFDYDKRLNNYIYGNGDPDKKTPYFSLPWYEEGPSNSFTDYDYFQIKYKSTPWKYRHAPFSPYDVTSYEKLNQNSLNGTKKTIYKNKEYLLSKRLRENLILSNTKHKLYSINDFDWKPPSDFLSEDASLKKIGDNLIFSLNKRIIFNEKFIKLKSNTFKIGTCSGRDRYTANKFMNEHYNCSGINYGRITFNQKIKIDNSIFSNKNSQEWKGNGSGFFISTNGYIATNYHVIEDVEKVEVELMVSGSLKKYNAVVINTDPNNDLAIIKIEDPNFQNLKSIPYNFKARSSDVGTEVFALGYPMALSIMGKEIKFTDGRISSKTGYKSDITTYQTTTPIQAGNSGGPLFDHNANLIGINSSGLSKEIADNVSYTIKTNYLLNLIDALPESVQIPSSTWISSKPLTEQIKILSKYVVLIKVK